MIAKIQETKILVATDTVSIEIDLTADDLIQLTDNFELRAYLVLEHPMYSQKLTNYFSIKFCATAITGNDCEA